MRRLLLLDVSIAWPGMLGDGLPEPPYGWAFLTDDEGRYLVDDDGWFLVGEW